MCLAVGAVLALAAGCGKSGDVAPPMTETDKATSAPKAEPAPTPETTPAQATSTTTGTVKPTPDTAAGVATTATTPAPPAAAGATEAATVAAAQPQPATGQATGALAGLSQDQMVKGLEEALGKGLQEAIASLGHNGGFLTNLNVRIPMPEKLQAVEKAARAIKQDKLADDFVATMNHAAEQAVPEAGSVFADALKQMSIQDAQSILAGPSDAATQYFQRTTQTNLYARFYPIVQKATAQNGVTAAYKNLTQKAAVGQSFGSLGSALGGSLPGGDSFDVDAYVTNKALEGLFKMVAQEEQQIRQNPVARTTATLQQVFGALKK